MRKNEQGGLVFGYLQRAGSLFGTGLAAPRCWGATADTAVRLNQLLAKQFCLAFADESYVKLTDLSEVDAIRARLDECDALILGTTMSVRRRAVVGGTYDRTPNDKAYVFLVVTHTCAATFPRLCSCAISLTLLDRIIFCCFRNTQVGNILGRRIGHVVVGRRRGRGQGTGPNRG